MSATLPASTAYDLVVCEDCHAHLTTGHSDPWLTLTMAEAIASFRDTFASLTSTGEYTSAEDTMCDACLVTPENQGRYFYTGVTP